MIKVNAIVCNHCGERIVSEHRHDFCVHSCAELEGRFIAVDGGKEYLRRVGKREDYTDASEEA